MVIFHSTYNNRKDLKKKNSGEIIILRQSFSGTSWGNVLTCDFPYKVCAVQDREMARGFDVRGIEKKKRVFLHHQFSGW